MRVEREFRKLENIEEIRIFELGEKNLFNSIPMEFNIDDNPLEEVMNNIPVDIHILKPYDDECKDFIVQSLGVNTLKRANLSQNDVKGRLFSKVSPKLFEILYNDLFEVYQNHTTKKIRLIYYEDLKVSTLTNTKIVFESGKLFIITSLIDPISEENINLNNFGIREEHATMIESFSQSGSYYRVDGKYVWSQGIYNIINRPKEESDKYYNIILDLAIPEDKPIIDHIFEIMDNYTEKCEEIIRIKTHDGILKNIEVIIHANFDEDGNFISYQGQITDITNFSTSSPIKPVDYLLNGFKNSKKMAILIEPLNSKHFNSSEGYYYLIEQEPEKYEHSIDIIENIVEKSTIEQIIKLVNGEVTQLDETFTYNVNGNPKNQKIVELYIESFEYGENTHSIGFLTDITEKQKKQNELIDSNEQKTFLIKEVHHRVKNNLQIINSFLNLEKRVYRSNSDRIVEHMQTRLTSLSLLHEKTYNTKDFKNIDLNEYILENDKRIIDLFRLQDEMRFESVVDEDLNLSVEVITPLLLIIAELTLNSLENSFTDTQTNKIITKKITKIDNETAELLYEDNGEVMKDPTEIQKNFGCVIITNLTKQLDGNITLIKNEKGTEYKLVFPIEMKHTMN